jgi:hypothetical protein
MAAAARVQSTAFLLAVIAACAGAAEPSKASANRVEACAISAKALCARAATCSPLYIRFFFETVPDCEAMVADACVARYDGPGASSAPRACADEAAAAPCEMLTDPRRALVFSTPPAAVLQACPLTPGSFDDHAPCKRDGDCKSGACGELLAGGGIGCEPRHQLGEACQTNDRVDCKWPAGCVGDRCRLPASSGTECTDSDDCASGKCEAGRCAPLLGAGASCDATMPPGGCDLTQGLVCADDLVCRAVTIVGPGEACDPLPRDIPKSTARLCDARALCSAEGTCAPAPRRGEPCTTTCRIGLSCESGRCVTSP